MAPRSASNTAPRARPGRIGAPRRATLARALAFAAGSACLIAAGPRIAPAPQQAVEPARAGLSVIVFEAETVHQWRDGDADTFAFEGDARLYIGDVMLRAGRGVAWITQGAHGPEVAAYLEDATREAAGGMTIEAGWLPVRGTLAPDASVIVRAGTPRTDAPRGDSALARVLDRADKQRSGRQEREARFTFSPPAARGDSLKPKRWIATAPPIPERQAPPAPATDEPEAAVPSDRPMLPSQLPGLRDPVLPPPLPSSSGAQAPAAQRQPAAAADGPIFLRTGIISLNAGRVAVTPGEQETTIIAGEGVTLVYREPLTGRTLQASAQRGVVFLAPGTDGAAGGFAAESVRGFYLEGEVTVGDGDFTVRGPHVYYDVANNRALLPDAVFSTFDPTRAVPIYVRAKELRQESSKRFSAERATLTTSAFFEPELSIGASSLTVDRAVRRAPTEAQPGKTEQYNRVTARNVVVRAAGLPIFWWPAYSGDPEQPLIKDLRIENRSGSGAAVRVRSNLLQLVGLDRTPGLSADLMTDLFVERGPALGVRGAWGIGRHKGAVFAYAVPWDRGDDVLKPGTKIDHDGDFRGIFTAEDRFRVNEKWTAFAEAASISDPTFIDGFFEGAGESRREFTNRLRAERTHDNTQFTAEAKGSFDEFLANEWLLQSQGYSVGKLPEAAYVRQADDLLADVAPGYLTHFSEYRLGRASLSFDETPLRDRGFTSTALSQRVFGVDPALSPGDALRAAGLSEDAVTRADTRQELLGTFSRGPWRIAPFAVLRATAYDDSFEGFSTIAEGNDAVRVWTALGTRVSTSAERIWDSIDSSLLDIHRLRHTVEPSATVWFADTNVESRDIPVFDRDVDSLADGASARIGLTQWLHTKRGAPGRWHDAELLRLTTDLVVSSDDADRQTPIGRFFDSRPEWSALGNYVVADAAYCVTDATSVTASSVYDLDTNQQDFSALGLLFEHEPGFTTLADLRFLNAQDSTVLTVWGAYELTDKYRVQFSPNYSASEGQFQNVYVRVDRRFSALLMGVSFNYDNIAGETGLGFVLQPYGARGGFGNQGAGGFASEAYGGSAGF